MCKQQQFSSANCFTVIKQALTVHFVTIIAYYEISWIVYVGLAGTRVVHNNVCEINKSYVRRDKATLGYDWITLVFVRNSKQTLVKYGESQSPCTYGTVHTYSVSVPTGDYRLNRALVAGVM